MTKIILICGKLCSGKSAYAEQLKNNHTVILSSDKLMRDVFAHERCLEHFSKLARAQTYLYDLAGCLLDVGVDVVLDFGYWKKSDRESVRARFSRQGHSVELHFTDVDDATRAQWIKARNELIDNGQSEEYYITEEAFQRLDPMFDYPDPQEVDVYVKRQ